MDDINEQTRIAYTHWWLAVLHFTGKSSVKATTTAIVLQCGKPIVFMPNAGLMTGSKLT